MEDIKSMFERDKWFRWKYSGKTNTTYLKKIREDLEKELKAVNKRIEELEGGK